MSIYQKELTGLRILHFLSPVKWDKNLFLTEFDSNFKVVKKTIDFLPYCHHYIMMPKKHDYKITQNNVTLLNYNYTNSGVSSKGHFDFFSMKLDFDNIDIDFVFLHQPELLNSIQTYFNTKRAYSNLKIYCFYHWLDVSLNRVGGDKFNPVYSIMQLNSMLNSTRNFVHSDVSINYLSEELAERDVFVHKSLLKSKLSYMPLSSNLPETSEKIELPNKKILVFNHRFNDSSNISLLLKIKEQLSDNYEIWVTDNNAPDEFKRPRLNKAQYKYLLENCTASLCLINKYSTWNLSIQDSLIVKKPVICYKHSVVSDVLDENYPFQFETIPEFFKILNNIPERFDYTLKDHDKNFKENLLINMSADFIKPSTTQEDKIIDYKNLIDSGVRTKKAIHKILNPNLAKSNGFSSIRLNIMKDKYLDDYTSPIIKYFNEKDFVYKDINQINLNKKIGFDFDAIKKY